MFTFRRAFGFVPIFTLALMGACSAGSKKAPGTFIPDGTGGTGTSGAGGSTGGTGNSTGGGTVIVSGGSSGTGGSIASGAGMGTGGSMMIQECAGDVEMGMPVPVDVYVMLDISGSMLDPSGTSGVTKWDAVKSALNSFFTDAQSAGLSVAIQYFPLRTPGTPTSCTSDTDCGTAGPCLLNVCAQTPSVFVACTPSADPADTAPCTNAVQRDDGPCTNSVCHLSGKACTSETDCQTIQPSLGKCVQFGSCAGDPTLSCGIANPGHDQPGCGANNTAGMCVAATSSFCVHETQCDPDAYATPAVDFLTLPDTAMALSTSIAAQMPAGDTPTRQALLGAVAHARAHAAANIGHSVVILLATDGLPTDCTGGREVSGETTAALNDVVAVTTEAFTPAVATNASIQTFVIGVFADSEQASAQMNLDQIAKAGGSDQAFVVTSGGDVQQEFLTALNDIRSARLSCEFQLPTPASGSMLDLTQVNVELTTGVSNGSAGMNAAGSAGTSGMSSELYYVTPTGCTGADDEWHYDQEPKATKLVACPKTCDMLKMTKNAQVSVKLGCMQHIR
jgi:hypothetical protein